MKLVFLDFLYVIMVVVNCCINKCCFCKYIRRHKHHINSIEEMEEVKDLTELPQDNIEKKN